MKGRPLGTDEPSDSMIKEVLTEENLGYAPPGKRFVADSMLGKLAKWLRTLGFDTHYEHLKSPGQLDDFPRPWTGRVDHNRRCKIPLSGLQTFDFSSSQLHVCDLAALNQPRTVLARCIHQRHGGVAGSGIS